MTVARRPTGFSTAVDYGLADQCERHSEIALRAEPALN